MPKPCKLLIRSGIFTLYRKPSRSSVLHVIASASTVLSVSMERVVLTEWEDPIAKARRRQSVFIASRVFSTDGNCPGFPHKFCKER